MGIAVVEFCIFYPCPLHTLPKMPANVSCEHPTTKRDPKDTAAVVTVSDHGNTKTWL